MSMSRALLTFAAAALAGCHLDQPLATACRNDNDCVGANRCVSMVCRAPGDGGGPMRGPGEAPTVGGDARPNGSDGGEAGAGGAGGAGGGAAGAGDAGGGTAGVGGAGGGASGGAGGAGGTGGGGGSGGGTPQPPPDAAMSPTDAPVPPPDMAANPTPDAPPLYSGDPCCVVSGVCGGAAITPTTSGQVDIPPATDFVPLCNGWVLLGDRAANQLSLRNVFSQEVKASYQLPSAPNRILLDVPRRLAIVAFGNTTALARIDLQSGSVTSLPLGAAAKDIALSGSGQVLALTGTDQYWAQHLEVIDEHTGAGWKVMSGGTTSFGNVLAYRPAGSVLFMTAAGLSPSGLSRFSLNWQARTVTALDSTRDNGSNCHELVLSEDGTHLAVPCGSGNGTPGYTIFDRGTDNVTTVMGEWNTGPYPAGAAFTRDGKYLAASDTRSIQIYSVSTHARLSSFTIPGCDYGTTTRVRTSLDSAFAYALTHCGFMADTARLTWNHVP
jgi:hypothetical protein